MRDLLAAGECLTVEVSDRFGSYGLTGVVIFRAAADALAVDTFLLSCRALGRGVEHRMLARLGESAMERGLACGGDPVRRRRREPSGGGVPANASAALRAAAAEGGGVPVPGRASCRVVTTGGARRRGPPRLLRSEGARRGRDVRLRTHRDRAALPEAVLARCPAARARPPAAAFMPPRTALERELAELWGALLNVSAVGVDDNFFDLGGHSLLAVQLLSRVRQEFGVELSLEVVYSGDSPSRSWRRRSS